jgi:hypothetical protein
MHRFALTFQCIATKDSAECIVITTSTAMYQPIGAISLFLQQVNRRRRDWIMIEGSRITPGMLWLQAWINPAG